MECMGGRGRECEKEAGFGTCYLLFLLLYLCCSDALLSYRNGISYYKKGSTAGLCRVFNIDSVSREYNKNLLA